MVQSSIMLALRGMIGLCNIAHFPKETTGAEPYREVVAACEVARFPNRPRNKTVCLGKL
jgi:hypothetical protein